MQFVQPHGRSPMLKLEEFADDDDLSDFDNDFDDDISTPITPLLSEPEPSPVEPELSLSNEEANLIHANHYLGLDLTTTPAGPIDIELRVDSPYLIQFKIAGSLPRIHFASYVDISMSRVKSERLNYYRHHSRTQFLEQAYMPYC